MLKASREISLIAVLATLALLVGHASFALHATSHDLADSTECELCISYGNVACATNAGTDHDVLPARDIPAGWDNHDEPMPDRFYLVRPRGPPSAN